MMGALLLVDSDNASFMGFNYGANFSLFPASIKDFFGLKNFGANYGLVCTAWGAGGLVLPKLSQVVVAATGTFNAAYVTAAILLALSAGLSLMTKAPRKLLVSD
jgi:nitrate/nitrite transporter NarK